MKGEGGTPDAPPLPPSRIWGRRSQTKSNQRRSKFLIFFHRWENVDLHPVLEGGPSRDAPARSAAAADKDLREIHIYILIFFHKGKACL